MAALTQLTVPLVHFLDRDRRQSAALKNRYPGGPRAVLPYALFVIPQPGDLQKSLAAHVGKQGR